MGDVTDVYDGTHQTPSYQDHGIMFLSVENISTLESHKYISRDAFNSEFKIRPEKGDVLMTRIGDVGRTNVVNTDDELAYYVSLALIKSKELNSYFLKSNIDSPYMQNRLWQKTLHIAFPKKINKNEISKLTINYPEYEEQEKIGTFINLLDDTITLHQRKLEQLELLKKAYLQQMFPEKDEVVPKLRFADFSDVWENRKLRDIVNKEIKGRLQAKDLGQGDIEFLDTARLNGGLPLLTNQPADVDFEDIIILWDGSKAGTVYTGFHGVLGSTLKAYQTNSNNRFVFAYLQKKQEFIYQKYRTPNIPHVQKDFLEVFSIEVPISEEQNAIGNFFSKFDNLIKIQQTKIIQLQSTKQFLLNHIFI